MHGSVCRPLPNGTHWSPAASLLEKPPPLVSCPLTSHVNVSPSNSGWFGPSELKAFDPVSAEKAKSSLKKGNALRTALSEALDPSLIAHRASAVVLEEDDDHDHDEDDAFNQESAPRKKATAKPKKTKIDTTEKKKKGSTTDDSAKRKPAKRAVAADDDDDEDDAPKVRNVSKIITMTTGNSQLIPTFLYTAQEAFKHCWPKSNGI